MSNLTRDMIRSAQAAGLINRYQDPEEAAAGHASLEEARAAVDCAYVFAGRLSLADVGALIGLIHDEHRDAPDGLLTQMYWNLLRCADYPGLYDHQEDAAIRRMEATP